MKWLYVCLLFPFTLIACATPSTLLITPDGQVHRCSAYGTGAVGVSMASSIHNSCVNDFKKMGAVEYPRVGWGIDTETDNNKIIKIYSGSPAEKSDVFVGDIILEIDGITVEKKFDVIKIFSNKNPGDTILVKLNRDGKEIVIQSSLTTRNIVQ